MRNKISYEWTVECLDEFGDIQDQEFFEENEFELAVKYLKSASSESPGYDRFDFGLLRKTGNDADGEVDRGYAYVKDGELEVQFCNHEKVPERFIEQVRGSFKL